MQIHKIRNTKKLKKNLFYKISTFKRNVFGITNNVTEHKKNGVFLLYFKK